jgi:hypothetical protein
MSTHLTLASSSLPLNHSIFDAIQYMLKNRHIDNNNDVSNISI